MNEKIIERFLIRELIDRYCDVINQRDWDVFADFWTEDAIWEALEPFNMRAVGREQVLTTIRQARDRNPFLTQIAHAVVIDEVGAETARAHQTLYVICKSPTGTGYSSIGLYSDELRRTPDGWRFSKRSYRPSWFDPEPPKGYVIESAVQAKSRGAF